jgi:hypothetical protein
MPPCKHDGFHSGEGRYCSETRRLRYVLVCDACRQELQEVHVESYQPAFDPKGNDPFLNPA